MVLYFNLEQNKLLIILSSIKELGTNFYSSFYIGLPPVLFWDKQRKFIENKKWLFPYHQNEERTRHGQQGKCAIDTEVKVFKGI